MFPRAMESGTALPIGAVEYSLGMVDKAEIYIGLFAQRYGYIPDGHDTSITEMEYRRAVERGIPRLIFISKKKREEISGTEEELKILLEQTPESREKLDNLKKELERTYVVSYFDEPDDLGQLVMQALQTPELEAYLALLEEEDEAKHPPTPQPEAQEPQLADEPEKKRKPYVAHDYIAPSKFFGRKTELAELDEWAKSDDALLIVEAIGGIGKSALTWEWFNQHAEDFDGAMWWSFYESDGAMENFIRHALAYTTRKKMSEIDTTPRDERERLLLAALREGRYLLVMDGIERALVAYHNLNAPQMTEEQVDKEAKDEQLRSFTDPRHSLFLKRLAGCAPSKVLVSTRLTPIDLEERGGGMLKGVRHKHLNGLAPGDALDLMTYRGIHGTTQAMLDFMEQFDRHSLLLNVIAGKINDYYPAPGDFDQWYADEGKELRLTDLELAQRRTHILGYALAGVKPELVKLLGQIGAFRYPVDYKALNALNPYLPPKPLEPKRRYLYEPDPPPDLNELRATLETAETEEERTELQNRIDNYETELAEYHRDKAQYDERKQQQEQAHQELPEVKAAPRRFHAALSELENRGLLQWERESNRYDLHPVVRGYTFEQLAGDDRTQTFLTIRDYFEKLHDLRRLIEIYYALVNAGLLDEAGDFYYANISKILLYDLAAYLTIIELLKPLFTDGLDRLPPFSLLTDQSYFANHLATAFNRVGQERQALALWRLCTECELKGKNAENLAASLYNYSVPLNGAAEFQVLELVRVLTLAVQDNNGIKFSYYRQFYYYARTGQWSLAEEAYTAFCNDPPDDRATWWLAVIEEQYAWMQFCRRKDPTERLDKAWELAVKGKNPQAQVDIWTDRAWVALRDGKLEAAAESCQNAATLARKLGQLTVEYTALMALIRAKEEQSEEARRLIAEAGEPDDYAAKVYLTLGEPEKAKEHALEAYKEAWGDGPPYSTWWLLERAKKVLDALGEPYPEMPPFDPEKVEPIPFEAEIRAFIEELKAKREESEEE
jgi:hypothetical protein